MTVPLHSGRREAPRYDDHEPASREASEAKRHNAQKDTKAELLLRQALWARGLRYRLHAKDLPGRPDIVFRGLRIAIFVDGDFWHGRDWAERRKKLQQGANADYWLAKIAYNIERDGRNTQLLQRGGWTVIRLWETDILRAGSAAADEVSRVVSSVKSGRNRADTKGQT
jgi:DNA mismatch endonuclease (patch repair protein)